MEQDVSRRQTDSYAVNLESGGAHHVSNLKQQSVTSTNSVRMIANKREQKKRVLG